MLGITQARVSHYLGTKKSTFITNINQKFGVSVAEVQSYAKILSDDVARSQIDGIFTLYSVWRNMLYNGTVCSIHQKSSRIPSECSVCMELHKPARDSSVVDSHVSEDNTILRDLSEAVSMLEPSSAFQYLIPEVAVNIATSRKGAKSSRDVAAIPGRINRIHGRAKAFMPPEFGCSNHSSKVLLCFSGKFGEINSVMNLRYDQLMEKALAAINFPRLYTSPLGIKPKGGAADRDFSSYSDPVLQRMQRAVVTSDLVNQSPFAVIDRGSEGLEPMTYLLGTSPVKLADAALKISHAYVSKMMETPA